MLSGYLLQRKSPAGRGCGLLGGSPLIRLSCWSVCFACHGDAASPGAGRAVYPTTPRGFLYLFAGVALTLFEDTLWSAPLCSRGAWFEEIRAVRRHACLTPELQLLINSRRAVEARTAQVRGLKTWPTLPRQWKATGAKSSTLTLAIFLELMIPG